MAADNFSRALSLVLLNEGGWSDHPMDPGGATMKGVTQRVYDAYRDAIDQPRRTVKMISEGELRAIYKAQYWDAIKGDMLPAGLDYCLFDYAVNSGPVRAIKALQEALGIKVDGQFGMLTLGALKLAHTGSVIVSICKSRLGFLQRLRTWGAFGRGWTTRVKGVEKSALMMLSN